MKLTNLINSLFKENRLTAKMAAEATGLNETWIARTLRGENTMVKLDALLGYLTENVVIDITTVPDKISFKTISKSDEDYYLERGKEMVEMGGIDYVTSNDVLNKMNDFVKHHKKLNNNIEVICEDGYVSMYV